MIRAAVRAHGVAGAGAGYFAGLVRFHIGDRVHPHPPASLSREELAFVEHHASRAGRHVKERLVRYQAGDIAVRIESERSRPYDSWDDAA